jgi:hypothetical protein
LTLQRRVHFAGALILVLGWIASAVVFVRAQREDAARPDTISAAEQFQIERLGGKATARTVEFDHWLASLWHGERLAWTLAVLALAIGGSCMYVAGLMGEAVDAEAHRHTRP